MRLTDEQIMEAFCAAVAEQDEGVVVIVGTVRRCLALAAQPDAPSDYNEIERRGFEVSQPGELPR